MNHISELRQLVKGTLLENEPMAKHTSYGIGGPASAYIMPKDRDDLAKILKFAKKNRISVHFVGSGSNLLVNDHGIDGLVITPAKALRSLKFNGNYIEAESGVMLGKIVKESIKRNLTGLESLVGVPGTLGGALIMNAGAFGGEISNYLKSIDIMELTGKTYTIGPENIDFGYRHSSLKPDEFILLARFELPEISPEIIQEKRAKASQGRKKSQPLRFRSAGSVFKNPGDNLAAGYLIDQAGLKGTCVGDAEISRHHANFFVNHGSAKATDIAKLIRLARKTVYEKYGVMLELEVNTIGFSQSELDPYAA